MRRSWRPVQPTWRRLVRRLRAEPGVARLVRRLPRARRRVTSEARHVNGQLKGLRYRVAGRVPDPAVSDEVLADRIRSGLGPLEKRLDIPRLKVHVDGRIVDLHGEVRSGADAEAVERWVRHTPGVRGVESYVRCGLHGPGGRRRSGAGASPARRELIAAARGAGAVGDDAERAVRAVLGIFVERLPADTRRHLLTHLPADVRVLTAPPRRHGQPASKVRTVADLLVASSWHGLEPEHADRIAEAVLGRLRQLVPDAARAVAAVLPEDLRRFWLSAVPG